MGTELADVMAAQMFAMARDGLFCEVVIRVNGVQEPTPEMLALRVYGLLRCGDMEPALVRLAQLVAQTSRDAAAAGPLRRWAAAMQSQRMPLAGLLREVDEFYRVWDHNLYFKAVTQAIRGREMDFIAAAVADVDSTWRVLIGVADAFKIREEMFYAFEIYSSMCRIRKSPALLKNLYSTALLVRPDMVYPMLQEFSI